MEVHDCQNCGWLVVIERSQSGDGCAVGSTEARSVNFLMSAHLSSSPSSPPAEYFFSELALLLLLLLVLVLLLLLLLLPPLVPVWRRLFSCASSSLLSIIFLFSRFVCSSLLSTISVTESIESMLIYKSYHSIVLFPAGVLCSVTVWRGTFGFVEETGCFSLRMQL